GLVHRVARPGRAGTSRRTRRVQAQCRVESVPRRRRGGPLALPADGGPAHGAADRRRRGGVARAAAVRPGAGLADARARRARPSAAVVVHRHARPSMEHQGHRRAWSFPRAAGPLPADDAPQLRRRRRRGVRAPPGAHRMDHRGRVHPRQCGAARGAHPYRELRAPLVGRTVAMTDLVIAGGGPVGLAAALYAVRAGLSVVLYEPRAGTIDKACGEGLMPGAVAALAGLGVHPAGHRLRGIRYIAGDRRAHADFRAGPGLGVRRTTLHAALRCALDATAVQVVAEPVTKVTQDATGIVANDTRGRYLIAADG